MYDHSSRLHLAVLKIRIAEEWPPKLFKLFKDVCWYSSLKIEHYRYPDTAVLLYLGKWNFFFDKILQLFCSQDTDANEKDNRKEFSVTVKYEADLVVKGYVSRNKIVFVKMF